MMPAKAENVIGAFKVGRFVQPGFGVMIRQRGCRLVSQLAAATVDWQRSQSEHCIRTCGRYDQPSDGLRRRRFPSLLEQALPEARKAPLIIYRLFPRAVRIVTALAFGNALWGTGNSR